MSLAVEMRPAEFDDVVGQSATVKVLQKQVETGNFAGVYLFVGSSGCGKTTVARILANKISKGLGRPIEIDAASNNGVDAIRDIVAEASTRSLDGSPFKIFIIDEVQAITSAGWSAFLKCIEEVSAYTVFIFCTTEEHKVPETIKNRCMRFFFSKIPTDVIKARLEKVCAIKGIAADDQALSYIATLAKGCMREALSLLEKVAAAGMSVSLDSAVEILGDFSYNAMFTMVNALYDCHSGYDRFGAVLKLVDDVYDAGKDIRLFVEQFLAFCLDLVKYSLYHDIHITDIPEALELVPNSPYCVRYVTDYAETAWLMSVTDMVMDLKSTLRADAAPKTTAEVYFARMARL